VKIIARECNQALKQQLLNIGLHDYEAFILASRNLSEPDEVNYTPASIKKFIDKNLFKLKGIEVGAKLLAEHIINQKNITIAGDYDCDGATATATLVAGIALLGGLQPSYVIPDRRNMGYGLSQKLVDTIPKKTDLIITVDNGISSFDGVDYAVKNGFKILITDHHLQSVTDRTLNANAVINPNQIGCQFPDKNISGVGVAFLLLIATNDFLEKNKWYNHLNIKKPSMFSLLDYVAIGTVADVVPLSYLNRSFIVNGLSLINKNPRIGLKSLIVECGLNNKELTSMDVAFMLAPKLNAAGRISDMKIGIKLLLSSDMDESVNISKKLVALNSYRKEIESEMKGEVDILLKIDYKKNNNTIVYFDNSWHEGVIGIVAGRIKDKFNTPTIIFTESSESGVLKGSGRSIANFNIKDAISNVNAKDPTIIEKFGGHAMAAGLTINTDKFELFCQLFEQEFISVFGNNGQEEVILFDDYNGDSIYDVNNIKKIFKDHAWGNKFEQPMFKGAFKIEKIFRLKNDHIKFILIEQRSGLKIEGMLFAGNYDKEDDIFFDGCTIKILYMTSVNYYNNTEKSQIIIKKVL
jgi:single-stranded-DNA-specific exonuclease